MDPHLDASAPLTGMQLATGAAVVAAQPLNTVPSAAASAPMQAQVAAVGSGAASDWAVAAQIMQSASDAMAHGGSMSFKSPQLSALLASPLGSALKQLATVSTCQPASSRAVGGIGRRRAEMSENSFEGRETLPDVPPCANTDV